MSTPSRIAGDFLSLLESRQMASLNLPRELPSQTEATTVFAFRFADGVLVAGDRRATAGNIIVTDSVEKIIEIDSTAVLAIAGVPAMAFEMARVLQTSFEYYRRSQLQPLSLAAKVRALAKLLRDNLSMTLQGVGIVAPIFAGLDPTRPDEAAKIYFYDPLGAQFQHLEFAASGSGSSTVKSVLTHQLRFGCPKPAELDRKAAVALALELLATASSLDSATGGVDPQRGLFADIRVLAVDGIVRIGEDEQSNAFKGGKR